MFVEQTTMEEITDCSPYGASTIAGGSGALFPSKNEMDVYGYRDSLWHDREKPR